MCRLKPPGMLKVSSQAAPQAPQLPNTYLGDNGLICPLSLWNPTRLGQNLPTYTSTRPAAFSRQCSFRYVLKACFEILADAHMRFLAWSWRRRVLPLSCVRELRQRAEPFFWPGTVIFQKGSTQSTQSLQVQHWSPLLWTKQTTRVVCKRCIVVVVVSSKQSQTCCFPVFPINTVASSWL